MIQNSFAVIDHAFYAACQQIISKYNSELAAQTASKPGGEENIVLLKERTFSSYSNIFC